MYIFTGHRIIISRYFFEHFEDTILLASGFCWEFCCQSYSFEGSLCGFSPSLAVLKISLSLIFHSFPIVCLDMVFFVIILHGVYSASWICGLVSSSILENSLSPVILLKALLSFSAAQPQVCFQNWHLPQRQDGSFGGLTNLSVSLVWTPHPTMSHCLWGSPKALKPILCCLVFLIPQQEVWSNSLVDHCWQ